MGKKSYSKKGSVLQKRKRQKLEREEQLRAYSKKMPSEPQSPPPKHRKKQPTAKVAPVISIEASSSHSGSQNYKEEEPMASTSSHGRKKQSKEGPKIKEEKREQEEEETYGLDSPEIIKKVMDISIRRNEITRLLSKPSLLKSTCVGCFVRVPYQVGETREYHVGKVVDVIQRDASPYTIKENNEKGQTVERLTKFYLLVDAGQKHKVAFQISKVSQNYETLSSKELSAYFAKNTLRKSEILTKKLQKEQAKFSRITENDFEAEDLSRFESKASFINLNESLLDWIWK